MRTLFEQIENFDDPRKVGLLKFHYDYKDLIDVASGSSHNHQAWVGGYKDHIAETLRIADEVYAGMSKIRSLPFTVDSAKICLLLHDIEKIWLYSTGEVIDKQDWYFNILPKRYDVFLLDGEVNALEYAHGEVYDFSKTERKMGRLAAFVHACDCMSARLWHDEGKGLG
jgi:hypothetical protein